MLLLLITAYVVYPTFLLNFINFCPFVQRLHNKNQGGPVIVPHRVDNYTQPSNSAEQFWYIGSPMSREHASKQSDVFLQI